VDVPHSRGSCPPRLARDAQPPVRACDHLHGEPVHTREAFKRALELPQWPAGPLHQTAYRGNLDRVRSLVDAGADVTARDERFGATALDWAGWTKRDAVVANLKSVIKEADHSDD
jgi:hypothetical protein